MDALRVEWIQHLVLLGALCVGGAIIGVVFGTRRRRAAWPRFFAFTAVALGVLAACATASVSWMSWSDYDKGIRASVESAERQGYEVYRSSRRDGTVVYKIRNYVVPDGSLSVVANRSPFRPSWWFVAGWPSVCGTLAALVSLIARKITHRQAEA